MQIIKDWHLAMYVAVLAAIDIILLTVVTAIPEARSVGKLVVDQEHPPFRDVSVAYMHDFQSVAQKFVKCGIWGGGEGGRLIYIQSILHCTC